MEPRRGQQAEAAAARRGAGPGSTVKPAPPRSQLRRAPSDREKEGTHGDTGRGGEGNAIRFPPPLSWVRPLYDPRPPATRAESQWVKYSLRPPDCALQHLERDCGSGGKTPPHLRGSEPRVPRVQESQMGSRRAGNLEHMALLLRPILGGIRSPPQPLSIQTATRGSPPLPPPTGFPA